MQPKQLANVLVKVLGLSQLITGLLTFCFGLLNLSELSRGGTLTYTLISTAHGFILMAIGVTLICRSQSITGLLFKGDKE